VVSTMERKRRDEDDIAEVDVKCGEEKVISGHN
jgi:hypothetical protein